ncbi:MAG TPA: tetratricopeptide repeat protein [Bacteroidales bacterium]|nr:tetratricopeptide repeat protein [Bacteroidales bacterium]HQK68380.1 tetratricopeptide repeat protein [Bacteroidales bacterium]
MSKMEDDKFGYHWEEEIKQAVQKYERMRRNNEKYFFDVIEFESIIDYYIDNNNSVKAFEAATLASQQHPNSVSIQLRKARVLLDKGRAVETLKMLRKLENIEPGNHEVYIVKGTALGMLGDIQGARKMFDFALTLDSDETENILFSIVTVLQNLNYYEQMIPYMLKLIEMEPDFKAHLYDLAYAYEKIENYNYSIIYYLKYLEEEPFSDSAWYNLGIIYNKLDQSDKALEAYDFALAINSQNTFALFNKGNILSNLERYADAIPVYLEYLENEPDSFEAMTYLGECYEKINDYVMSRKYYQDAIDLAPEYADPWFGLGVIELNSGNVADSLIFFRKAVRLDDENPEYWYLLGKAHYIKRELKSAMSCFREALKIDTYYDEAWADLGRIILKENLAVKAIPYFEHAYQVTGNIAGINYLLAACYLQVSESEKAFRHLSLALESGKDYFREYSDLFPKEILTRKINKLLKNQGLIL